MSVDGLYDSLFTKLTVVSSHLSKDEADGILLHINHACVEARTSATAGQALNELSSYFKSTLHSTPELLEAFEKTLRPWMELQKLRSELEDVVIGICAIENPGESDDETNADLSRLKGRKEGLQQQISALEATVEPPRAARAQACAGIRNRNNRCFIIGTIKALWASQAIRQSVAARARQNEADPDKNAPKTALFLDRLFRKLDVTPAPAVLEPNDEAVCGFITEFGRKHHELLDGHQQDAVEFLQYLFADIFGEDATLLSYKVVKKHSLKLKVPIVIPAIDLQERVRGNFFVVNRPDREEARLDLQEVITSSSVEEAIEPEPIINSDRNKGQNPEAMRKALEGIPHVVRVQRAILFSPPPPPCLLVQLVSPQRIVVEIDPKLKDLSPAERALIEPGAPKRTLKIRGQVHIPRVLTIRSESERCPSPRYKLKSVIIHHGEQRSGHYFTDLPVDGLDAHPSKVVNHNDERVTGTDVTADVQEDLDKDADLAIYDLDPSSVPHDARDEGQAPAAAPQ